MRGRVLVVAVVLALVGVACAGEDATAPPAGAPGTIGSTATTATRPSEPTTTTSAPTTTTTVPREPATGALRSPQGPLVPLRARLLDGSGWVVATPCGNEAVVAGGTVVESTRVLVDPGHGGPESGAISPLGLRESELNLDVALRLEQWLLGQGVAVELTRRTDEQVTIATRAELARALGPELAVSVHHNGGAVGPSPVPGTVVFHQADAPASRRLAGLVHEELTAAFADLPVVWVTGIVPGAMAVRNEAGEDYYGLLRRAPEVPTVIVEALYMTGAGEAALLELDTVRQAEAEAIGSAILRHLTTTAQGSGFRADLVFGQGAVPSNEPAGCTDAFGPG